MEWNIKGMAAVKYVYQTVTIALEKEDKRKTRIYHIFYIYINSCS